MAVIQLCLRVCGHVLTPYEVDGSAVHLEKWHDKALHLIHVACVAEYSMYMFIVHLFEIILKFT